jgi:hypothetical protein
VLTLYKPEKVDRNGLALVNELEKGMLTVRPWLAEVNLTHWVVYLNTVT